MPHMNKIVKRILIGLLIVLLLGYASIIIYLKTNETEIVYYEFYGQGPLQSPSDSLELNFQRIELNTEDGLKLIGWIVPSAKDSSSGPWLLFCHGNASDISYPDYILRYKIFNKIGINVLAIDYRGFGESGGKPSEEGLYNDALTAYNYLNKTIKISPERIIIYGHSLGAAVAIDLATKVQAGAIVAKAAFKSVPDMGQQLYPFLPMNLLVKNKFMSIDKVSSIAYPKLFIHSIEDEIISINDGKALFEKAIQPKSFLQIKGNHDSAPILSEETFIKGLSDFLSGTTATINKNEP
jgi:fermentation-respiration switch protein FrsA (DUF1100 family)